MPFYAFLPLFGYTCIQTHVNVQCGGNSFLGQFGYSFCLHIDQKSYALYAPKQTIYAQIKANMQNPIHYAVSCLTISGYVYAIMQVLYRYMQVNITQLKLFAFNTQFSSFKQLTENSRAKNFA